jgi:hypothetical protein
MISRLTNRVLALSEFHQLNSFWLLNINILIDLEHVGVERCKTVEKVD